jgi:DNA invertase Pin-like site-specific DNA recombinase
VDGTVVAGADDPETVHHAEPGGVDLVAVRDQILEGRIRLAAFFLGRQRQQCRAKLREVERRRQDVEIFVVDAGHLGDVVPQRVFKLRKFEDEPANLAVDAISLDRPQLTKLMTALKAGDVVVVTKLDRLGRSTRELLDLIEHIGSVGAAFRSLGDPLWDTSSSQGRLLSTLLAAIAEFERELIKERTGEGRKRAQAAGVKFGRKPKLSAYQRQEAIKRRAAGETLAEIAKSYAVDVSMISRLS